MIEVKLIDKMGSDLSVVNAARVSFANKHEEFDKNHDERLIKYLAKHNHWSPFAHCSMQFHIRAPVFVARQMVKHQVGLSWNEVSRRYVDIEPEFYDPVTWRQRSPDKKQGSLDQQVRRSDIVKKTVENFNDMGKAFDGWKEENEKFYFKQPVTATMEQQIIMRSSTMIG